MVVGVTQEEVGFDLSRPLPRPAAVKPHVSCSRWGWWSCLRVMTPDGYPAVYAGSIDQPGAWITLYHSSITLAAFMRGRLRPHSREHLFRPNCRFFTMDASMFRKLHHPKATVPAVTLTINGQTVSAEPGDSIAAVLLRLDPPFSRTTPVSGSPRTPYCMMGVCFGVDCVASTQTCLVQVREGMRVERQHGRRALTMALSEDVVVSNVGDVGPHGGMPCQTEFHHEPRGRLTDHRCWPCGHECGVAGPWPGLERAGGGRSARTWRPDLARG
ncbi:MAG: hypothetical protein CBARDCOR_5390 [uncultured Caballeronia sp.]|nr:MAG: hypothetical protein CBARDCOR_5390 [uncultured Caballeronia sp.]